MKIRTFVASACAAVALLGSVAPSMAQFYPYPNPPMRPYYGPHHGGPGYGGPHFGGPQYGGPGYYSPYRRPVVVGDVCETSRGACRARPAPEGTICRCNIPGFGPKRGAIAVY